jgi:PleD family two-component response regulator
MILLPWAQDSAEKAAHCLNQKFRDLEFPASGHQTVSIGVTQARAEDSLDDLLVRVDKALYEAKRTGKDRYVIL